jgi:hypothetical protein
MTISGEVGQLRTDLGAGFAADRQLRAAACRLKCE